MNIQDDKQYTIYEKELNGKKYYRLQMAKKNKEGKYENGFVDITFAKCEPPKDRERIYLKNAWWSFYKSKDGRTIPYIVCMGFETVEQAIEHSKETDIVKQDTKDEYKGLGSSVTLEDLDIDPELPF